MIVQILQGIGIVLIIGFLIMYFSYSFGLSLVFKKLGEPRWHAYILAYNFMRLIKILHLPKKWFVLALTPYVGVIYSVAVAARLGKVFHKGLAYSSFWLTVGSPLGMLQIGFSKIQPDLTVLSEPTPSISALKKSLAKIKTPQKK